MFRPGGYASQYRHGSSGIHIQGHPVHGPMMHGRGPAYPGGYQQNMGFGHPPAMPPRASHAPTGFPTLPCVENQGTASFPLSHGTLASMPPLEPQHFPRPPPQPPLHGQPPRYPLPPPPNFAVALPPGPPVDIPAPPLPPRPTFSPILPQQPSSGLQLAQSLTTSHMVLQHMPQLPFSAGEVSQPFPPSHTLHETLLQPPPPSPAFSVCQPSPFLQTQLFHLPESTPPSLALGLSQPPPISIDMSNPLPPSHSMPLPPPPQKPNDCEIVQNIEILSEFVVKNGPEFENMARARQAGNPKFAFLFNGTAGSDAAIGYQYFQWVKMKWELQMKMGQEAEDRGQSAEQLEPSLNIHHGTDPTFESQALSTSPALSDVDMEDDFVITETSVRDDKGLYSNNSAGISTSNEKVNRNVSSNMMLKATNSGGQEEVMPMTVAHMDFLQSELRGKKELSHLTFEQQGVEEKIPAQSTGVAFRQITKKTANIHDQALNNEGYENTSFIEEQQMGSNVTPGSFNLVRNYQEMMPEDFAHRHVGLICADGRTPKILGFTGKSGENMEVDKFEHNDRQVFEHSHVGNGLGEASEYLQDHDRPFSWTKYPRREPDYEIAEGEVPKEEVKERIGSPVNEGINDSESDEVLYTANGLKRGCRSNRVRSPGDSRLRSCSRSPRRHRSRTRSPRRQDNTKDGKEIKGICLNFEIGMCYEGSSCKFVHHKAGPNSIVDYSDEESEKGQYSKEMEQDLKVNSTSPGKQSDGHDNPVAREEKNQEDSSGKGEKSPEWDLDFASEPYSVYFDREIFQPSVLHREGLESQPLRRDDFRPLPLRREDFEPQIPPREDNPSQPLQREGLQPQPLQREDLFAQFLCGEDSRAHILNREEGRSSLLLLQREGLQPQPLQREDLHPFLRGKDSHAYLLNREEGRPSLLLQEDMQRLHKQPFLREGMRAKAFIRDDLRAHPLFHEDIHARPLFREDVDLLREQVRAESFSREDLHSPLLLQEDLHAHPLHREDVHSQPLLRGASCSQPLLRDDFRVPSLLRDDLDCANLLRKDIYLDPFWRGNLRSKDEDLQRHALFREEIHVQHLLREKSRLHAEGFLPREGLHPRLLSREDAHFKALARDLTSHQLDKGNIDPLLYRNPSMRQSIALPVNSSFSSHLDLMRIPDPLRLGHTRSSSLLNYPREVSLLGKRHALHSEVPFRLNTNLLSQPDLIPSMPHTLPPHSPRNTSPSKIYRTEVQPQPTYCHAHAAGPSVPGPSTLHGSTPGGPYDALYDRIDPAFRSKLFDLSRGEQISPMGAVMASDLGRRLRDVNPKNDGGNTKTTPTVQSENAVSNTKDNFKGDYAVEAATDAEVGVVDDESPRLGGQRDGSAGHCFEVATTGAGEIDMDQTHANEKTRNIKDIRALKAFRTALAEFAKELLKPTWREGHISKEAFKLIVKKAVDKVAGTLQSHQIPNSQERIDQYLESSRVKFTKLVEGYVDKYVKI